MRRLIHALQFELKPLVDDGRSRALIVRLNRNGKAGSTKLSRETFRGF